MFRHFLMVALLAVLPGLAAADSLDDLVAADRKTGGTMQMEQYVSRARAGDANMQRAVGAFLIDGWGGVRDVAAGLVWLERAGDNGNSYAFFQLGTLYEYGRHFATYPPKAAFFYEKSHRVGNVCAAQKLARMHDRSDNGLPESRPIYWYERCAENGEKGLRQCQEELGRRYLYGRDVPQDFSQSLRWMLQAVEPPDHSGGTFRLASLQEAIGFLYQHGRGVAKNLPEAVRWYSLAIDNDSEYARWALAELNTNGIAWPTHPARAAELYEAAAERGHQPSQYRAALAWRRGEGVARDPVRAVKWLVLATQQSANDPVDVELFERDPILFGLNSSHLDPVTQAEAAAELASLRRTLSRDQFTTGYAQARRFELVHWHMPYCGPHGCPDCW